MRKTTVPLLLMMVLAYAILGTPQLAAAETPLTWVDVYENNYEGYPQFRIPVLTALDDGTLLAFAEARQEGDHSENDIVVRRSFDKGKTWGPLQIISEMGGDSLNDPCVTVLPDSGRILLMFQRFPQGYHARKMDHTEMADLGYGGPRNTQTFLTYSDDKGATWAAPRDITQSVRPPEAISIGSPGNGVVLARGPKAGRVLLPIYQVVPLGNNKRYWRNRVVFSDDQGETWQYSALVPDQLGGFGNENQIAELEDGSIRMITRLEGGPHSRGRSLSTDGGETWSSLEFDRDLLSPPCMASLIGYMPGNGDTVNLYVSLPNTADARENGTVLISRNGGESWRHHRTLYPGTFAYSCLAVLPDGSLGALIERDEYDRISFAVFAP